MEPLDAARLRRHRQHVFDHPPAGLVARVAQALMHHTAHRLRQNQGYVETFRHEGTLMVGFRCNCGTLQDVVPVNKEIFP